MCERFPCTERLHTGHRSRQYRAGPNRTLLADVFMVRQVSPATRRRMVPPRKQHPQEVQKGMDGPDHVAEREHGLHQGKDDAGPALHHQAKTRTVVLRVNRAAVDTPLVSPASFRRKPVIEKPRFPVQILKQMAEFARGPIAVRVPHRSDCSTKQVRPRHARVVHYFTIRRSRQI